MSQCEAKFSKRHFVNMDFKTMVKDEDIPKSKDGSFSKEIGT